MFTEGVDTLQTINGSIGLLPIPIILMGAVGASAVFVHDGCTTLNGIGSSVLEYIKHYCIFKGLLDRSLGLDYLFESSLEWSYVQL